jgi:hypothetical protein
MRALFICVLAASLAGCGCFVSPGIQTCTGLNGDSFACFDRHADLRLNQLSEPDPASFEPESSTPDVKPRRAPRKVKLASANGGGDAIHHAGDAEKPAPPAAKLETPAWVQHFQASDPVIAKAKTAVAAKLEDPGSAVFDEMDRAVRKNTLGQSVDSICGRVKSKRASGDENETRPFLYLVKDEEAFVVDDSSASAAAAMAYQAICK